MRAESVIDCPPEREAVTMAMRKALSPEFKAVAACAVSPFGDGHTSEKILSAAAVSSAAPPITRKKSSMTSRS